MQVQEDEVGQDVIPACILTPIEERHFYVPPSSSQKYKLVE